MDAVVHASSRSDAWATTERDHLVRAVAGVLGSDAAPEAVRAFLEDGGYAGMLTVGERVKGVVSRGAPAAPPTQVWAPQCSSALSFPTSTNSSSCGS